MIGVWRSRGLGAVPMGCIAIAFLACAAVAAPAPQVEALVERAKNGDRAALEALIESVRKDKDAEAEYALGMMAYEAKGLERNLRQAFQLVQRAAQKGHAEASNALGHFYQHGVGTPVDLAQALAWYRRGATAGSPRAQANLGWFHEQGIGVDKDPAVAADWYRKAAAHGIAAAQSNLAGLHASGLGVALDPAAAIQLYKAALEGGLASAGLHLGRLLEQGGNLAEASGYYLGAARAGIVAAELPAGRSLVAANNPLRNLNQGVYWLDRAAARDQLEAILLLATIYDKGVDTPREPQLAAGYFRRAAERGDREAAFWYADFLDGANRSAAGEGTPQDPVPWYKRAAEKGHVEAQFRLAQKLESGGADARKEAVGWYRQAAAQGGHMGSVLKLAIALDEGLGTAPAPAEAVAWYERAAQAGSAEAMYRLGGLYDSGRGTRADFGRARDYYSRAAALGHPAATQVLQKMVGIPNPGGLENDPFKGIR